MGKICRRGHVHLAGRHLYRPLLSASTIEFTGKKTALRKKDFHRFDVVAVNWRENISFAHHVLRVISSA